MKFEYMESMLLGVAIEMSSSKSSDCENIIDFTQLQVYK